MTTASTPELRRAMGLPHATALVVGTIIGASIFVQPADITNLVPSVSGIIFVWLVAGVFTMFGALVCAELASIFLQTGGVYVYLKESFAPPLGFLWGWAMFWVMHSGIIAAISVIFARYVAYFIPMGDAETRATAIACIVILSAINILGVKPGSTLQTLITAGKLLAIALIIVVGFVMGARRPEHFVTGNFASTEATAANFLLAVIAGLFAFGGWHMVTYNAEETIAPRRTIPRALMVGVVTVTVCYIAMNAVYLYVLPLEKVGASSRIAADFADALLGFGGGAFMSALVVFSTFGALSGIILAGPRVYYAMARDGLLFGWVARVHPRYRTPARAIVLQGLWSAALVATGTYRELFTRVIYTEWLFFGLMAIGLILLRKRPDLKRDYRIWGYPVVPVLFTLFSLVIVVNQFISDPLESATGLSIVLAGLPVYYLWTRRKE